MCAEEEAEKARMEKRLAQLSKQKPNHIENGGVRA